MKISTKKALDKLRLQSMEFLTLFEHGTLSIEIYQPDKIDKQLPHEQDEVYVIISGSGTFFNDGSSVPFSPGDLLFVKAGKEHRFENFSKNFSTWVIFYGPKGGE